jgi:nitric oxide synthase-interacting protein
VPSLTPATEADIISKPIKLTPICPASTEDNRHEYSLKTLVDVHFTEDKSEDLASTQLQTSRVCPSCKKVLTNGLKAMRKSCSLVFSKKFFEGSKKPNPRPPLTMMKSNKTLRPCDLPALREQIHGTGDDHRSA